MMYIMLYFPVGVILSLCIGIKSLERIIGFGWAFFLSFTLTPLIGFFLMLDSPKKSDYHKGDLLFIGIFSIPFFIIGIFLIVLAFTYFRDPCIACMFALGCIGAGIYGTKRMFGK